MTRIVLLSFAVILSASAASAKLAANGTSLNGVSMNGISVNGESLNGVSGDATPVVVQAITLADGTLLMVAPAR